MGIGFGILFWAFIGTILSIVAAIILAVAAILLTRQVPKCRRLLVGVAAFVFPFICLGWAGILFGFQAIVNETLLHRDAGLGDEWRCPLPNGYAILMIDETNQGWVYDPKTQRAWGEVAEQEDAIAGVRRLQLAGRYILGGADREAYKFVDAPDTVDFYFILDTRLGKRVLQSDYATVSSEAIKLGIKPDLEPIYAIYARYRSTWFDAAVAVLFCLCPVIGFMLLNLWVILLRKSRSNPIAA